MNLAQHVNIITERVHLTESAPVKAPYEDAVKATWWLEPRNPHRWIMAFIVCPACGLVGCLSNETHFVESDGKVTGDGYQCPHGACEFKALLQLDGWHGNGLILHAIAIDKWSTDKHCWLPGGFVHVHALDPAHAKEIYSKAGIPRGIRILGASRVIGYIAEDDNGDVVRA